MVRIAWDSEQRRFAWISLLTAVAAGAGAFGLCAYMRTPAQELPRSRTLTEYPVRWVCTSNPSHRVTAPGRFDPLPCPTCGAPCDILLSYVCRVHKSTDVDVFIQFERVEGGQGEVGERVARYRFDQHNPWETSMDGRVPCPVKDCGLALARSPSAWSEKELRNRRGD